MTKEMVKKKEKWKDEQRHAKEQLMAPLPKSAVNRSPCILKGETEMSIAVAQWGLDGYYAVSRFIAGRQPRWVTVGLATWMNGAILLAEEASKEAIDHYSAVVIKTPNDGDVLYDSRNHDQWPASVVDRLEKEQASRYWLLERAPLDSDPLQLSQDLGLSAEYVRQSLTNRRNGRIYPLIARFANLVEKYGMQERSSARGGKGQK